MPDAMDYSHSFLRRERTYRLRAVRVIHRVAHDRSLGFSGHSKQLPVPATHRFPPSKDAAANACRQCEFSHCRRLAPPCRGHCVQLTSRQKARTAFCWTLRSALNGFTEACTRALEQGLQQRQQHLRRERCKAQVATLRGIPLIESFESRCRRQIARNTNSVGGRQIDRNKTLGLDGGSDNVRVLLKPQRMPVPKGGQGWAGILQCAAIARGRWVNGPQRAPLPFRGREAVSCAMSALHTALWRAMQFSADGGHGHQRRRPQDAQLA
jgi:hypothetical protein